jgi:hypothetical protein
MIALSKIYLLDFTIAYNLFSGIDFEEVSG